MIYIKIIKGKYKGHYGFIDLRPNNYFPPEKRRVRITTNPTVIIESPDHFDFISEEEYTVGLVMAL